MIKTFPKAASFFKRTSLSSLLFGVLINQSIASGGIALYPANTSPTDAAPQIQSLQAVTQSNTATAPQTKEILPYNAEYKISSNSLTTTATRTLSKQGNNWLLSQHAKLMFIKIDEESLIENTKDGLATTALRILE